MGGGMSKSLMILQGQIVMSDMVIIGDKNDNMVWLVNQINFDFVEGCMQDVIGQIYFIDCIVVIGIMVIVMCIGFVGMVILVNSIVQDISGYLYFFLVDVVILLFGVVDVVFQNQVFGFIVCFIGVLNMIYCVIQGWLGIINVIVGVLGNEVESRVNFEYCCKQLVVGNFNN